MEVSGTPGATAHNKVLIPNNSGGHQPTGPAQLGGGVVSSNGRTIIHKANKLNYICQINPTKLYKLSGTITNLQGELSLHRGVLQTGD